MCAGYTGGNSEGSSQEGSGLAGPGKSGACSFFGSGSGPSWGAAGCSGIT